MQTDDPPEKRSIATSAGTRFRRIAISMVASFCLAAALVFVFSEREIERIRVLPESLFRTTLPPRPESAERGRHLATVLTQCPFCHGNDLGGRQIADDPWIGRLDAPNLTAGRGGVGQTYGLDDWARTIRFGLRPDGRSLLLMPSEHLAQISDEDLNALVTYLQQIPAVDRVPAPRRFGWLTRLVVAVGGAPELFSAVSLETRRVGPVRVQPAVTARYGKYLVDLGGCRVCHHADLSGGLHPLALPGEPIPPDLRPGGDLVDWTQSDFARAMREGMTPDQRVLDRAFMPWPAFAGLSDVEIEAIWLYLKAGDGPSSPGTELVASGR